MLIVSSILLLVGHLYPECLKKQVSRAMCRLQSKSVSKGSNGQKRIATGKKKTGGKLSFRMKSIFRTHSCRRTQKVWRRSHERFNPKCMKFSVKHPLSVQAWGAISYYGKSQLKVVSGSMKSEKYQNDILGDIKLQCECVAFPSKEYIFQQDKAPCHWSKSTLRYIPERGVNVLDWPGNSPDLNPIEEVWNIMKKKSGKLPNNRKRLWDNICNLWYSIPRETVMKLYDEMPSRVEAVCKAKGGSTMY